MTTATRPRGRPLGALTKRQSDVLAFLRDRLASSGRPPTIREIGAHFGILSPNGIVCHLDALAKKGLIERDCATARGIRIVESPDDAERRDILSKLGALPLERLRALVEANPME